jgi:haloalkane dehalogenase
VHKVVQTIPVTGNDPGYDVVAATEERLPRLVDRPMLICWGMRDFVFDESFLDEWRRHFPNAEVHRYEDAGHYILEDAGEEVGLRVEEFLARTD